MSEPASPPVTAPPAKPKGPRRESTRREAALKIAKAHPVSHSLLLLLGMSKAQRDETIHALSIDVASAEGALASQRFNFRTAKQFVEEIEGLDEMSIVSIKAVLDSRSKTLKPE